MKYLQSKSLKRTCFYSIATLSVAAIAIGYGELKSETKERKGQADETSSKEFVRLFSSLATDWTDLKANAKTDHKTAQSWLPDLGIRVRYQIAKSVISKSIIEKLVGEPVYLKGPHNNGMDFNNRKEFGHYNPKFLTKLHSLLQDSFKNKEVVAGAQELYKSQLRRYLRTYYVTYEAAANNEFAISLYQERLERARNPSKNPSKPQQRKENKRLPFGGIESSICFDGYDFYETTPCMDFWVRRSIDGTSDEFFDLLKLVLEHFDQEFLEEQVELAGGIK